MSHSGQWFAGATSREYDSRPASEDQAMSREIRKGGVS